MTRRSIFAIIAVLALLFNSSAAHSANFDHSRWDALLKQHVIELRGGQATEVDYAGFNGNRESLKQYLNSTSRISQSDFDQWSAPTQLAFLINSYNAWTVELVLTGYPGVASIKDLGSFLRSPWKKRFIPLLGDTRSLDDIEHSLIRGSRRYNDPRIHFAVNCASIGCPALRSEAYVADRLNAQLEDATQKFLSDRQRNRLEASELKVSSIFKWYREDFQNGWRGFDRLEQFLAHYGQSLGLTADAVRRLTAGEIGLDFLDYDWRLNKSSEARQPGRS